MRRLLLCAALLNLTACPELTKVTDPQKPEPCPVTLSMIAPPTVLKLRVSASLLNDALLLPMHSDYYLNLSCEKSPPYDGATKVYCAHAKISDVDVNLKEIIVQNAYFLQNEDRPQNEEISRVDSQGNLIEKMRVTLRKTEKILVYPRSSSCSDYPITATETTYSGELLD